MTGSNWGDREMHPAKIASCVLYLVTTAWLVACTAPVGDPSGTTQKDCVDTTGEVAPATTVSDVATAATFQRADEPPAALTCFTASCTSNATCESICKESSARCVSHRCFQP
ncbi:MAG: hypothetical protein ACLQBL_37705 [Polyangiaceae bacterium]